jgi:hypothetical protein
VRKGGREKRGRESFPVRQPLLLTCADAVDDWLKGRADGPSPPAGIGLEG